MREKLIELLEQCDQKCEQIPCEQCTYDNCLYDCGNELRTDHLIANGVTIQKWIPVSERLPETHRLVLCRWTRGIGASYGFASYQHDIDVWYVSNEGMPNVTHWMPLPEPPKGE